MVRIALLGCGTMGLTHANGYKNIKEAKVVSVCDIQKTKGKAVADLLEADYFEDSDSLYANSKFDVLDICLPTYLHKQYAIEAMKKGKHVFCEKPIALSVADAKVMVETAKTHKVKFSVGHVVRFFPPYHQAMEMMKSGVLGLPRLVRTTRNQGFPSWSWENWYQNTEKSGGPEVDLVIHDFDWIIHYFGKVERVYAKNLGEKVKGQKHCLCILRLVNGMMAHVEGSWALPKGIEFRTTFEIVGTEGQVSYDSLKDAPIKTQISDENQPHVFYTNPMYGSMNPYEAELRAFIQAVVTDSPLLVTGEEALEALQVALSAVESAKTGKCIHLKEVR